MGYDPVGRFFGTRFVNFSLSQAKLSEENMNELMKWTKNKIPFFIYSGAVGVGKTTLMLSLAKFIFNKKSKAERYPSVFCYPEKEIFKIISQSWKKHGNSESYEINKICEHELLFIDDLGASVNHDWEKSILFSLVDERYKNKKKTFFTTNWTEQEVCENLGERIFDRLTGRDATWIHNFTDSLRKN